MSATDTPAKSAPGGLEGWLVWSIAVAFVIYYFSFQTGYAIVNPSLQKEVGLSPAQVGIVAAVYTWVFAFCQFFSGSLLDRLGSRRVLLPCIALVIIGIFIFANAANFETLLLSQLFVAVGACAGFVGAGYVGGKWFGLAKFSFMFGLVQFAASLFSAFNQNLLHWALFLVPWRELFNYVAIAGIVLLLAAAFKLRDPIPIKATAGQSFGTFLSSVLQSLFRVASIWHIWVAAAFGSLIFGVMLALGVVWGPKLLMARGWDVTTANMASSLLWLGLAAGCFVTPWISDRLRQRKLPITIGIIIQLVALTLLLYSTPQNPQLDMALCFLFGFGNSAHMLAFSTAADVVQPSQIGTSAAIVNGMMFLIGGIMISRPGVRIGLGLDADLTPRSMELAQFASRPLLLGVIVALVIAIFMRETYPGARGKIIANH
jgi:MFS family permease